MWLSLSLKKITVSIPTWTEWKLLLEVVVIRCGLLYTDGESERLSDTEIYSGQSISKIVILSVMYIIKPTDTTNSYLCKYNFHFNPYTIELPFAKSDFSFQDHVSYRGWLVFANGGGYRGRKRMLRTQSIFVSVWRGLTCIQVELYESEGQSYELCRSGGGKKSCWQQKNRLLKQSYTAAAAAAFLHGLHKLLGSKKLADKTHL